MRSAVLPLFFLLLTCDGGPGAPVTVPEACESVACRLPVPSMWHAPLQSGFTWEWILKEDSYLAGYKGQVFNHGIVGRWKIKDNVIALYDTSCKDGEGRYWVATYRATLQGDTLMLSPISNDCVERMLTYIRPFKRFVYGS